MRTILIILFFLLYLGNSHICSFLYPYDYYDSSTHHLHENWWHTRDIIYEIMFFLILLVSVFKRTLVSKAIAIGLLWVVFCSIIDKIVQKIYDYHIHDIIVILGFIVIYFTIYEYGRTKEN